MRCFLSHYNSVVSKAQFVTITPHIDIEMGIRRYTKVESVRVSRQRMKFIFRCLKSVLYFVKPCDGVVLGFRAPGHAKREKEGEEGFHGFSLLDARA